MKWRLLAVACVLLALGLLLYPLMGELVSEKYHSDVEAVYTAAIADTDNVELAEQRRAAEAYNALLRGEAAVSTGGASASPLVYAEQLAIGGAMCTIDIPKIGVYLPVRHGTGVETLERAVGHVVGTSLPVGGAGTHAVLSAHSGMASAKLFTDIDQLVKGDVFYIHVLGEVLAYEVDEALSKCKKELDRDEKNRIKTDVANLRRCLRKDKPEKMNETEEAALRQAKSQLEESANHLMMLYTSQQQAQGPDQTL